MTIYIKNEVIYQTRTVELSHFSIMLEYPISGDFIDISITDSATGFSMIARKVSVIQIAFLLSTLVETLDDINLPSEIYEKERMIRINALSKLFLEAIKHG